MLDTSTEKWLTGNCEPLFNFRVTKSVTKYLENSKSFAGNCKWLYVCLREM